MRQADSTSRCWRACCRSTAPSPARRGTPAIDNEQLFALDVDILVLAALEGQITERQRR